MHGQGQATARNPGPLPGPLGERPLAFATGYDSDPSADFVRALYAALARVRARRLAGSAFLGFEEPCCPPVHADAARSAPGTPAGAVTVVRLRPGPRQPAVTRW